jgi:hypothetical protein
MNTNNESPADETPVEASTPEKGTQITYQIPVPGEYEMRVVAFLDIMAWRDLVERSSADAALRARAGGVLAYLKAMHELPASIQEWRRKKTEEAGQVFDPDEGQLQFAQFSDSIIISGDMSQFFSLIFHIWGINRALFYNSSILVRGAITTGLMYHKGSIAFGPAVTAAYELEQKYSIYPRIIFDRELTFAETNARSSQSPFSSWFRKAPDGFWFYDYLHPLLNDPPGFHDKADPELLTQFIIPSMNHSRGIIDQGLRTYSETPRIWEKYRWMADYFNLVVDEFPAASIAKIDLQLGW